MMKELAEEPPMKAPAAKRLTIRVLAAALVLGWAGVSVGGKMARYAAPTDPVESRAERRILTFMQAEGWREHGRSNVTANGTYTAIWFSRERCGAPIGIVVLGSGAEAGDAVRRVLGEDVAYLQDGRLTREPHVSSYALHALLDAAAERLGGGPKSSLPVLAITPAPHSASDSSSSPMDCAGPSRDHWERLGGSVR